MLVLGFNLSWITDWRWASKLIFWLKLGPIFQPSHTVSLPPREFKDPPLLKCYHVLPFPKHPPPNNFSTCQVFIDICGDLFASQRSSPLPSWLKMGWTRRLGVIPAKLSEKLQCKPWTPNKCHNKNRTILLPQSNHTQQHQNESKGESQGLRGKDGGA